MSNDQPENDTWHSPIGHWDFLTSLYRRGPLTSKSEEPFFNSGDLWYNVAMDEQTQTKLGVIDSLSLGFRMVARRPWLLLLPVLLDLVLWFGPRISIQPLVDSFLPLMQMPTAMPEDMQQMAALSREMLEQIGEHWNPLSLLARGVVTLPSFIANQVTQVSAGHPPAAMQVGSFAAALGWGLLIGLMGTLLGGLYLTLIAGQLRRLQPEKVDQTYEASAGRSFLHRLGLTWLRLIVLALLLLGGVLFFIVPASLLGGVLSLISPTFAFSSVSLLSLVAGSIVLWVGFILHFVTDAIVLDEVGVLQALWRSLNIVWRNLWPTMGLILLSYVIGAGFTFIWDRVASTIWGTAAGILGTAYIGAGLTAAGLAFYADRRQLWQKAAAQHTA